MSVARGNSTAVPIHSILQSDLSGIDLKRVTSHLGTPRSKRSDRYGQSIDRNLKKHKVCFADDRPNGKTSGVIFVKTHTVESFKEFNKLESTKKEVVYPSGKDRYVAAEDTNEYNCRCLIF